MPQNQFVAGPYRATYNAATIGITARGFELEQVFLEEPIQGDIMGESRLDAVYLGGDCFSNFVLQEAEQNVSKAAWWPWSASIGLAGRVGRMHSDLALSLVMTVLPGSRAATHGPATVTIPLSILPGNFPIRLLMGSRHRSVPMRMSALPYDYGQQADEPVERWFVTA